MDKSFRLSRRRAKSGEVVQNVKFRASFLKKKFVLCLTKILLKVDLSALSEGLDSITY